MYLLNDQLYLPEAKLEFWTLACLLNDTEFSDGMPEEFQLAKRNLYALARFDDLNEYAPLEFKDSERMDRLLKRAQGNLPFSAEELRALLTRWKIAGPAIQPEEVNQHLALLRQAIQQNSFYTVDDPGPENLAGEWNSIKESGQQRVNYNMTDFTPLGNQVKLIFAPHDNEYWQFIFTTKVSDYVFKKTLDFQNWKSLVQLKGGYLYHFRPGDRTFIFRRPVFDFNGGQFTTQLWRLQFTFQRSGGILPA